MKLVGTENAGYRITAAVEANNQADEIYGVVIAERIRKIGLCDFVTWEYNFYGVDKNVPSFYWGHYFNNNGDAATDYQERVQRLTHL